jgi:hypothetical protein
VSGHRMALTLTIYMNTISQNHPLLVLQPPPSKHFPCSDWSDCFSPPLPPPSESCSWGCWFACWVWQCLPQCKALHHDLSPINKNPNSLSPHWRINEIGNDTAVSSPFPPPYYHQPSCLPHLLYYPPSSARPPSRLDWLLVGRAYPSLCIPQACILWPPRLEVGFFLPGWSPLLHAEPPFAEVRHRLAWSLTGVLLDVASRFLCFAQSHPFIGSARVCSSCSSLCVPGLNGDSCVAFFTYPKEP